MLKELMKIKYILQISLLTALPHPFKKQNLTDFLKQCTLV